MSLSGQALADKIESDRAAERLTREFGASDISFESWRGEEPESKRGVTVRWEMPGGTVGLDPLRRPPWGVAVYFDLRPDNRQWQVHPTTGAYDYGVEGLTFATAYEAGKYVIETMLATAARKQLGKQLEGAQP